MKEKRKFTRLSTNIENKICGKSASDYAENEILNNVKKG